jgi:glutathione S-transferase
MPTFDQQPGSNSPSEFEIYWISGSTPAWRVLLTLELKELQYQSHILSTANKDQKQAWFLEINPRGQIPLLKHGERCITESLAIMYYLEKTQPQPSLSGSNSSGSDLAEYALVQQTVQEILAYVDKPIAAYVQPVFRNKIDSNRQSIEQSIVTIKTELQLINELLRQKTWLCGESISFADIMLIPTLQRLLRAINKAPQLAADTGMSSLTEDYPHLAGWNQRVESLEAFDKSFPPHWKE